MQHTIFKREIKIETLLHGPSDSAITGNITGRTFKMYVDGTLVYECYEAYPFIGADTTASLLREIDRHSAKLER